MCSCALSKSVYVCVWDISSSPLHSFLVKAIGDQWRLKVTNHPSSPHSAPPQPTSSSSASPPHPTCPHAGPGKGLQGPGSHSYLGPWLLLKVCRGSEAVEGNYSSALIGIIILAGWQRWITRQDPATVGEGGGGVGLVGRERERIRGEENISGREEHKMKGRSEEINLILASAEQLEQITPIIQGRCVKELCGPVAFWVRGCASPHKCVVYGWFYAHVCARGKGRGGGEEVY